MKLTNTLGKYFPNPKTALWMFSALALGTLSGCGWFAADEKAQLEQQWLAKDQELQQAIEQIRSQGLNAINRSAEVSSVTACVAEKLSLDPLGELIQVDGVLAEPARVSELLGQMQQLLEQGFSFENAAALLNKGADLAAYVSTLIESQGIDKALADVEQLLKNGTDIKDQQLGGHLQTLLNQCRQSPPKGNG
ncbi:hypothetical protein [Shewanella algae]|uniref:hypothetical protein n=1 Tax=Shewanella algae TaxID=38313 RepID=UPI0030C881D0